MNQYLGVEVTTLAEIRVNCNEIGVAAISNCIFIHKYVCDK